MKKAAPWIDAAFCYLSDLRPAANWLWVMMNKSVMIIKDESGMAICVKNFMMITLAYTMAERMARIRFVFLLIEVTSWIEITH